MIEVNLQLQSPTSLKQQAGCLHKWCQAELPSAVEVAHLASISVFARSRQ